MSCDEGRRRRTRVEARSRRFIHEDREITRSEKAEIAHELDMQA